MPPQIKGLHSKTAALFINGGTSNYSTSVSLAELNISVPLQATQQAQPVTVTDVWTGEDAGPVVGGKWGTGPVAPLDSRFVVFDAAGA